MSAPSQKETEVKSSEKVVRKYNSPQWPETIPESWTWSRVDWVGEEVRHTINPTSLEYEEVFHYSIPTIEETGDGSFEDPQTIKSKKLLIDGGEVLVSKLNPGKSRVITASSYSPITLASSEFIPLKTYEDDILNEYLEFVLKSEPVRQYLEGIATSATRSHQRVSPAEIRQLNFPLPPLSTQRSLLSYLDHHTARIDAVLEMKQKTLCHLEEKKEALITRAVTLGLDQTVATKETDVEVLGEIPEHWEPVRLKYLLNKIEQGWSPKCEDRPSKPEEWGVLKAGAAKNGRFIESENKKLPSDETPQTEYKVKEGDLLMNRASGSPDLVGNVALVHKPSQKLLLCDKLFRLHVREDVAIPEFLFFALRSHAARHQIIGSISGAEGLANNIPQADVKELSLALPPLSEQKSIAEEVFDCEAQIDSLTRKIMEIIGVLNEKRQALITAVVTGQLDLSDWEGQEDQELLA
ncbi:restriction endonuclease subunit S [Natrialbaceae archaeon A-CW1-1]